MQRSTCIRSGLSVGLAFLMQVSFSMADSPAPAAAAPAATSSEVAPVAVSTSAPAAVTAAPDAPAVAPVAAPVAAETAAIPATESAAPSASEVPAVATTATAASDTNVVVSVDGVGMTQGELDKRVASAMKSEGVQNWRADLVDTAKKQYEEQVKELFVTRTVLANEAKLQNITTTDAEIDEVVESLKGRLKPGHTLDELIADHGLTMDQLKKELADDRNIEKLIDQAVLSKNTPSDSELKAYYEANKAQFAKDEKVRASHILVKTEATDSPDVKKEKLAKIQALRVQLVNGADFAEVAKKSSDCPSAAQGGDLGEFGRGMMVKPFEDAAFSQEKGAIGEIVETQFGYHIIKVTEKTSGKAVTFDDVKAEVVKKMQEGNGDVAIRDYIDGLRAKATIVGLEPMEEVAPSGSEMEQPAASTEPMSAQPSAEPATTQPVTAQPAATEMAK